MKRDYIMRNNSMAEKTEDNGTDPLENFQRTIRKPSKQLELRTMKPIASTGQDYISMKTIETAECNITTTTKSHKHNNNNKHHSNKTEGVQNNPLKKTQQGPPPHNSMETNKSPPLHVKNN